MGVKLRFYRRGGHTRIHAEPSGGKMPHDCLSDRGKRGEDSFKQLFEYPWISMPLPLRRLCRRANGFSVDGGHRSISD
ncbi:MAG: hypothetical protein ACP5NX_04750 [Candidatus Bilamarchaeaceae archaeon]